MKVTLGKKQTIDSTTREWVYDADDRIETKEFTQVKSVGQHDKKGIVLTFNNSEVMVEQLIKAYPSDEVSPEGREELKQMYKESFCMPGYEIYSVEAENGCLVPNPTRYIDTYLVLFHDECATYTAEDLISYATQRVSDLSIMSVDEAIISLNKVGEAVFQEREWVDFKPASGMIVMRPDDWIGNRDEAPIILD